MAKALKRRLCPRAWPTAPVLTRRYSSMASWESTEIVNRFSASSTSSNGCPWRSKACPTRSWLASSATIVRRPRRAATTPRAVATVDLPTPPLPVTKIRRRSKSPGTAPEHSLRGGRGSQTPHCAEDFSICVRILTAYESPIASEPEDNAHLQGDRARQPEGWRCQDHDNTESGRGLRRGGAPRPVL